MFAFRPAFSVVIGKLSFGFFKLFDNSEILTQRDFEVAISKERQKIKSEMSDDIITENASKICDLANSIITKLEGSIEPELIKNDAHAILDILFPEPEVKDNK